MSEQSKHEPSITEWRTQELLVRLEERMTQVQKELVEIRGEMATKTELRPVKMVTYGLVSLMGTGLFGLLFQLLSKK